jgi:hypothetical protein
MNLEHTDRPVTQRHHSLAAPPAPDWVQRCGIGSSCDCPPQDQMAGVQRDVQHATTGGGAPLPPGALSRMGTAFSTDFSLVRVHTGSAADDVASKLDAHALTAGTDILFRSGAYRPGTQSGDRLLAHELAHVVQQREGIARAAIDAGPSDPLERAADAAANNVTNEPRAASRADLELQAANMADDGTCDTGCGTRHPSAGVVSPVRGARGLLAGGAPVDPSVRAPIEALSGLDLSGVRVHRPGPAHPLPGRAFTAGGDIVVPDGASVRSMRHELAHVVQNAGGSRNRTGVPTLTAAGPKDLHGDGGLSKEELDLVQSWIDETQQGRQTPPALPGGFRFNAGQFGTGQFGTGQFGTGQFGTGQFGTGQFGTGQFGTGQFGTGTQDPFGGSHVAAPCPNCHQRPSEILAARQASEERYRRKQAEQQRHGRWEASHSTEHGDYLKGPQTTLAQDVEESRSQLVAQRMVLLTAAVENSAGRRRNVFAGAGRMFSTGSTAMAPALPAWPAMPEGIAEAWATAQQETVVVRILTGRTLFVPEAAELARQHFVDLYARLVPVAEQSDRYEAAREAESQMMATALRPKPNPCPSCHDPMPAQPHVFRAPPPSAPGLRAAHDAVLAARTTPQWLSVLSDFERATGVLDSLALSMVPADGGAAQAFTAARDLLGRQETLQREHPEAIRIRAVFYPKDHWVHPSPQGPGVEIAEGIPWYFYLTHTPTQGDYDYPPGFSWTLRDVTSPGRPEVTYRPSDVERFLRMGELPVSLAPRVLFDELDDKLVFPEGVLYWRYPDGRTDSMRTTEPWSLSDWLTAIGIGLTALGLILATGGLATPGVLAGLGVASATFGIAATVADLQHRSELGILTSADTHRAILFIAADIVSVLSLGLGRAAALAGEAAAAAGRTTQIVVRLRQAAALATLADKALGATVLVTMGADFLEQYETIMHSNLSPAEREAALKDLAVSGLITGALVLGPHLVSAAVKHLGGPRPAPAHPGAEPHPLTPRPGSDAEFVAGSTKRDVLPVDDAARELRAAELVGHQEPTSNDPEYRRKIELGEHTWQEKNDGSGWCRFTSKRCYTKTQLGVGVGGRGERTSAATAAEAAARRAELARPPKSLRTGQDRFDWVDYTFYAERRLSAIEEALRVGGTPPEPPRTFRSFVSEYPPGSWVRNEIQGSRFEARTRAAILDAFVKEFGAEEGARRAELILSQPHLSQVLHPTVDKGMLTRPDHLFPNHRGTQTAISNKSRTSFHNMGPRAVQTQVVDDLLETVTKYTGPQYVRRTGGTPVVVDEVWLLYDAAGVPPTHRATIEHTVSVFNTMHANSGINFRVGIF